MAQNNNLVLEVNTLMLNKIRSIAFCFSLILLICILSPYSHADKAPDFAFKHKGEVTKLSSLKGQVVYLDFWASWCIPCKKSFPWMNKIHKQYAKNGLIVIAVNLDKEKDKAKEFLKKVPANFKIIYDPSGKLASSYDVKAMPSSYIIDQQGNIAHTELGFKAKEKSKLEEQISSLLNVKQVSSK